MIHSLPRRMATTRIATLTGRSTSASDRPARSELAHADAVRHLLGGGEIGDQRGRNAESVRHDVRDVDGRVADLLDFRDHVQHARHLLGIVR